MYLQRRYLTHRNYLKKLRAQNIFSLKAHRDNWYAAHQATKSDNTNRQESDIKISLWHTKENNKIKINKIKIHNYGSHNSSLFAFAL